MSNIISCGPNTTGLFSSEVCNIGNGAIKIDLRTCNVSIVPTMTIENAAKLAASTIYNEMRPDSPSSPEPEWLNKVTFSSEEFEHTPAIKIIDDKIWYNSPPFIKSKRNISFWTYFSKYWYVMVVHAMQKALMGRKDKTVREEKLIHTYSNIDV